MGLTLMNHYNKVYVMSSVPQELGDGYYCTYPIRVQVITGYAEPTVYLANSMKKIAAYTAKLCGMSINMLIMLIYI